MKINPGHLINGLTVGLLSTTLIVHILNFSKEVFDLLFYSSMALGLFLIFLGFIALIGQIVCLEGG